MKLREVYYSEELSSWCVPLTKGRFALIDEEDVDRVSQYNWYVGKGKHTHYAHHKSKESFLLHRFVTNAPDDVQVDHINSNGLDNRKTNLRFCNNGQNSAASRKRQGTRSKYRGVVFDSTASCKWKARVYDNGKQIVLGRFSSEEEAALAYNKAALERYGEFARINVL